MNHIELAIIEAARQCLRELLAFVADPPPRDGTPDFAVSSFHRLTALTDLAEIADSGISEEAVAALREIEKESRGVFISARAVDYSGEESTTPTQYILGLINSFPALQKKAAAMISYGPPAYLQGDEFCSDRFFACMSGWTMAERQCGLFILNVWDPARAQEQGWIFDWVYFLKGADTGNTRAFLAWVANPRWP